MEGAIFGMDKTRELLSERIVEALRSWPELHRRVFVQSHYRGESLEEISVSLGLKAIEVRQILENCDRRLRVALKSFRLGNVIENPSDTLQAISFAANGCYQ
jgi:DNA-directed RNA polymerase specialized sigma24 family protein